MNRGLSPSSGPADHLLPQPGEGISSDTTATVPGQVDARAAGEGYAAAGCDRKQCGFSLVTALFLIVVLAMLGVIAVRISVSQQQTVDLSLLGARALSAANAGIEWGAYRALKDPSQACDAATTFTLTESASSGFVVTVNCTLTPESEQGVPLNVYDFISTARYGAYGQPDYVNRKVRARFTHAP